MKLNYQMKISYDFEISIQSCKSWWSIFTSTHSEFDIEICKLPPEMSESTVKKVVATLEKDKYLMRSLKQRITI